jgi:hypothetical protein
MEAFTLDEWRSGLEPVDAAGDTGLGVFQSPLQIYKIQCQLQDWFHISSFIR